MNPNNKAEEYIFFGFPVNDEVRCKKWLEFCCREELYKLSKKQLLQRMICSKHFVLSDFVSDFYDRLNATAIPRVYDPKQSLYNIGCVLCGRFRKDPPGPENDGATFHHFPGEELRCLKWLDFVGVESYYRLTRKEILFCFICSKHFARDQFVRGFHNRLVDRAVPIRRFPDDEPDEEPEQEEEEEDEKYKQPLPELFASEELDKKVMPLAQSVLESQECAACGRLRNDPRNKSQRCRFHPFPAYEIGRCLKWCEFLGREDILKMSPNQIRKLVLCSGHFRAGQNFNNSTAGPCDAVPTMREPNFEQLLPPEPEQADLADIEEINKTVKRAALVTNRKPKPDIKNEKPTPLAKKRGKSRRPTAINIPKIEPKVNSCTPIIQKFPIPAAGNWKIISNQLQPITITSNMMASGGGVVSSGIKKVIMPFSGDISNLGAPIPVNSLSSIPPGLLIKIDLPDIQGKNNAVKKPAAGPAAAAKKRTRNKKAAVVVRQTKQPIGYDDLKNTSFEKSVDEEEQSEIIKYMPGDVEMMIPEVTKEELVNQDFEVLEEETAPFIHKYERVDDDDEPGDNEESFVEEVVVEEKVDLPKVKMSTNCRRTLMPIQCELRRFVETLRPHIRRLPKKSKAQVKLAIVNMVIDRL